MKKNSSNLSPGIEYFIKISQIFSTSSDHLTQNAHALPSQNPAVHHSKDPGLQFLHVCYKKNTLT